MRGVTMPKSRRVKRLKEAASRSLKADRARKSKEPWEQKLKRYGRTINGVFFHPTQVSRTKTAAKNAAAALRRKGSLARVTKEKDGFVVWLGRARKKRKK
jgi:hypothetical protein